jgi:hypothetical protein
MESISNWIIPFEELQTICNIARGNPVYPKGLYRVAQLTFHTSAGDMDQFVMPLILLYFLVWQEKMTIFIILIMLNNTQYD